MSDGLIINEIFLSVQGESTFGGLPCVFVRLTACDLRCSYCDTAYAFTEGRRMSLSEIEARVEGLAASFKDQPSQGRLPLVEITGGEPLLQPPVLPLMQHLCGTGRIVLLETSGAHDIGPVDPRVRRIVDLKCPSSGEVTRNRWANLPLLKATDEVKFVIGTREDYTWAKATIQEHRLASVCPVLLSWVVPLTLSQLHGGLKRPPPNQTQITQRELAERILADALPVRFQVQLHKLIWSPDARGV